MSSREQKRWEHSSRNTQLRQVRKQIKRSRKEKRPRHKPWREIGLGDVPDGSDGYEEWYELELVGEERVMPKGERARRQAQLDAALESLRKQEESATNSPTGPAQGLEQGIVLAVNSGICVVEVSDKSVRCSVRGQLSTIDSGYTNVVAAGDRVLVSRNDESAVVEEVLPRHSVLARPDVFYSHLRQVVVANADQLLVVAAWRDPKFWPELVDRYLIAAEQSELEPIICVNKVDLAQDLADCRSTLQPYIGLGYRVLFTSAVTRVGIDELADLLSGQTTVLAGMSGVGKSSLLNAVQPGMQLRTAEVSEFSHTGRHTTTQSSMIPLQAGGYVIDTPGIREFGLSGLYRTDLIHHYPELAEIEGQCRFADCSHTHEPGCAVKRALQQGTIAPSRLKSYQQLYASLPENHAEQAKTAQERAWR